MFFPNDKIVIHNQNDKIEAISLSKYQVGQEVKCSKWGENGYWEGEVVHVLKDVLYKVRLKTVSVKGTSKLYLNPSDCTGQKRLSYEDGRGFRETEIWVHERCLD